MERPSPGLATATPIAVAAVAEAHPHGAPGASSRPQAPTPPTPGTRPNEPRSGARAALAALRAPDVIVVVVAAVVAIVLGAPTLGCAIGAGAWVAQRVVSAVVQPQIEGIGELRRRLGYGVGLSMGRVWALAGAIVVAGVAGERHDGLSAALEIFGAFSIYFTRSALDQMARRRSS